MCLISCQKFVYEIHLCQKKLMPYRKNVCRMNGSELFRSIKLVGAKKNLIRRVKIVECCTIVNEKSIQIIIFNIYQLLLVVLVLKLPRSSQALSVQLSSPTQIKMSVIINNIKQAKKPGVGKADLSVKGKEDKTLKDILNGTLFALSESFSVLLSQRQERKSSSKV